MDFSELINKRYSVRAYKPDPVEDEKLQKVLEAARLAPTACNNQPFQFDSRAHRGRKEDLKRIYKADWFSNAPIVICGCAVTSEAWVRAYDGKNHCDVDVTIAMDHLILAATELGLGTCWIAAFNPAAAKEVLGLPEGVEPVIFTPLGYPADAPREKSRKALSDIVRWDKF